MFGFDIPTLTVKEAMQRAGRGGGLWVDMPKGRIFAAMPPPGQDMPPLWQVPAGPGRASAAGEKTQRLLQQ